MRPTGSVADGLPASLDDKVAVLVDSVVIKSRPRATPAPVVSGVLGKGVPAMTIAVERRLDQPDELLSSPNSAG